MKIKKGKVNYIVTDDDEYIMVDSVDSISINQPIPENDRCIVCVTVFGQDSGVTHFITREEAEKNRDDIIKSMKKRDSKSISNRFARFFSMGE